MPSYTIHVNRRRHRLEADSDMPLLWALRDGIGLTGTKFACGAGLCGACTVLVDGRPVRSCTMALAELGNAQVTTIEGLADHSAGPGSLHPPHRLHRLQQAWIDEQVPQCGYCQSGMLMAAAALLAEKPRPSDEEIAGAMSNLCRCGTYARVRRAIRRAAGMPVEAAA